MFTSPRKKGEGREPLSKSATYVDWLCSHCPSLTLDKESLLLTNDSLVLSFVTTVPRKSWNRQGGRVEGPPTLGNEVRDVFWCCRLSSEACVRVIRLRSYSVILRRRWRKRRLVGEIFYYTKCRCVFISSTKISFLRIRWLSKSTQIMGTSPYYLLSRRDPFRPLH